MNIRLYSEEKNTFYYQPLHSETIDLEPEDFEQATQFSDKFNKEAEQWQAYLNILALLALEKWLSDRHLTLDNSIESLPPEQIINSEPITNLQVDGFKICLLTDENIVNEGIEIPEKMIYSPDFAAHFYVFIQVFLESEEAVLIGFIRHDKLNYLAKNKTGNYHLSLSRLNYDSSHLILNLKYLSPAAIKLPEKTRENLTNWLEGIFTEGWESLEELLRNREPRMQMAFHFRDSEAGVGVRRAIDLGSELAKIPLALMIEISPETNERFNICSRVYSLRKQSFLPANLKFIILDEMGKSLKEISATEQDNYIQFTFTADKDDHFSLQVSINSTTVTKDFSLDKQDLRQI